MTSTSKSENSKSLLYRMFDKKSRRKLDGSMTGSKSLDEAIAGIGAGLISTISLHPLETIKTRLQG